MRTRRSKASAAVVLAGLPDRLSARGGRCTGQQEEERGSRRLRRKAQGRDHRAQRPGLGLRRDRPARSPLGGGARGLRRETGLQGRARPGRDADRFRGQLRRGPAGHRHPRRIRRPAGPVAKSPGVEGSPRGRRAGPRLRPQPARHGGARARPWPSRTSWPPESSRGRSGSTAPRPRRRWAARSTWSATGSSRTSTSA